MTLDRQPRLESELVMLQPLAAEHFDPLYAIAADPRVWDQHPSKDRGDEHVFREWFDDALRSQGALVAIERCSGDVIGTSRFGAYDSQRREIEIGWTFLARSHWGGSFNAEIKQLMLGHAFRAVDTVVFRVHDDNLRSQRAVEKLGAIRVGRESDPLGRGHNIVFRLNDPGAQRSVEPSPRCESARHGHA